MHFIDKYELLMFAKRANLERSYIEKLKKDQISIIKSDNNTGMSKIGGVALLPREFKKLKDSIFICQFDLSVLRNYYPEEIELSNFPKTGLLSVFIKSPRDDFYGEDCFHDPSVKLLYFKDFKGFKPQPFMSDDYVNEFPEQFISFSKSCSVPIIDFNPEFEISAEQKKAYELFESELYSRESVSSISNFFGWSSNFQPILVKDYEKIQKYYKTKSKVIHLFTLNFGLETAEVAFGTISVFLLEEDLLNGIFNRAWMIPCFD
jgi:uncharacterized protein YwqG